MNPDRDPALMFAGLGPDFRCETGARGWFAVRRADEDDLRSTGFGAEADGELRVSSLSGRKPLHELATRRGTLLVRRYSHGGLLRFATGRRFADPTRPFREIVLAAHLERAGIATARIVAARARAAGAFGYELDLVMHRVEDAVDLGWVLGGLRRGEVDPDLAPLVCALVGTCVRRLHAAGFLHADLTPNNLLVRRTDLERLRGLRRATRRGGTAAVEGGLPELVVVDLDRARLVPRPSDDERRTNLRRLFRFVERREARDGRALRARDYGWFFRAYDPSGLQWKADWRAIAGAHARAQAFHGLGWSLERLLGRGPDPRESGTTRRER